MKKVMSVLLTFAMILVLWGSGSLMEVDASISGYYEFQLINDGNEVEITGYTGTDVNIVIPSTILGKPVTSIGECALIYHSLESIVIPDSVIRIENEAFAYGQNFENPTVVTIGNGVTSIGNNAFLSTELESVIIGSSVTSIGDQAFSSTKLEYMTIPESVMNIGYRALDTGELRRLILKNGSVTMHQNVFGDDPTIPTIFGTEESQAETFASSRGYDFCKYKLIDDDAAIEIVDFFGPASDFTIPSELEGIPVTNIGDSAFESVFNDTLLTSVTIPESVTDIGAEAFKNNTLESVSIPDNVTFIGHSAFIENNLNTLTIGNGLTEIKESAFYDNELESLTIGTGVTAIGQYAFSYNKLKKLTIPDGVVNINEHAFSHNVLEHVFIGTGVTQIADEAFAYNRISSAVIPANVTYINGSAFYNQTDSDGLTVFGEPGSEAESHADSFEPYGVQLLSDGTEAIISAYYGEGGDVVIPSEAVGVPVTEIGYAVFSQSQLTGVIIPDSVTYIGAFAFKDNQLESIAIPSSVDEIGVEAFTFNELTEVTISNPFILIDSTAFDNNQDVPADLVINGNHWYSGTYAEKLANDKGYTFVGIWMQRFVPTVTVNQALDQEDPAGSLPITFTAIFSEPVTGFDESDVTVGGTAGAKTVTVSGVGNTYTIKVSDMTQNGTVTISIPKGAAQDFSGDLNEASTSTDNLVTYEKLTQTVSDYEYVLLNQGSEVEITKYTGQGNADVTIPSTIDGKPVTSIGEKAFRQKHVTGVVIPDSVETIKAYAFSENVVLNSVKLGSGVKTIEHHAFYYNRITDLIIGNNITTIEPHAFYSNELTSVTIPASVTTVGDGAFGYSPLSNVTFLNGGTIIDDNVFANNRTSASSLTIHGRLLSTAHALADAKGYNFSVIQGDVEIVEDEVIMEDEVIVEDEVIEVVEFSDMEPADWFYDDVNQLVQIGGINGYPDGSFKPDLTMKKGEFIKLIVGGLGCTQENYIGGHWAMNYINAAKELGIVDEDEYPESELNDDITRKEMAKIAVKTLELSGTLKTDNLTNHKSLISDLDTLEDEYKLYVLYAYANGILMGYPDGAFKGDKTLTRAEGATVAIRIFFPERRVV